MPEVPDDLEGQAAALWQARFPSADLVDIAADQFARLPAWRGEEGPRWRVTVSPGALAIGSRDLARQARTHERAIKAHVHIVASRATWVGEDGEGHAPAGTKRAITAWSPKSRAAMTRALCELDYSPLLDKGLPAMVTLTYPGDWLTVAPTGEAVKRHLKVFRLRWRRAWGEPLLCWKQEFQRRGAPHIHMLCVPPMGVSPDGHHFRQWLSRTWAAVVAHPDPEQFRRHVAAGTAVDYAEGMRMRDPKRIAVYFTKHGTFAAKEYQHDVPPEWQAPGCGPGRFWGVWGLKRRTAETEIAAADALTAARTMRRWAGAQGTTRQRTVRRIDYSTGQVRYRKVRRRVVRVQSSRGWVSVNDGPAFASTLATYLERAKR